MKVCRQCQRPLPRSHAGGSCPSCVLDSALKDVPEEFPSEDIVGEVPADLGDYELLGEIGRGGTSVVYRARQRRLNRIVALKTLHGSALASRDAFERLQTEAQAVARLDHPHIVPLYEVGRHGGTHFLTLRFFQHGSLAEALKSRRFTPVESARFLATAARAVHHAHSRGVLHRDLKPSNLLLDEHGTPHVADFGLAKLADSHSSLTLSTSVLGTPAYMAPEQAAGNAKEAGTPADIYALGVILFELLTGRTPFLGRSTLEVLRLVADTDPPMPTTLVPGLDRDLEAVCLRCLEKDPARRYASAAALSEDLERWLRHEPLSVRPLSPRERVVKWVRRRPGIAALTAACVLAVIGALIGITWQWQRANRATQAAQAEALATRQNAYVAEMSSANQAVNGKSWQMVRSILERTRPAPGQQDVRGWEWRYLWGISRIGAEGRFVPGTNNIGSIAVLEDGHTVALGEIRGGFCLWDVTAGRQVYRLPTRINQGRHPTNWWGPLPTCRVAVIPKSGLLAYTECVGPTNGYVHLWNIARQEWVRSITVPGFPRDLAVSLDGNRLACSLMWPDNRTLVFDVATSRHVNTFESTFQQWSMFNTLAFSADGRAVSVEDMKARCMRVVDVETGKDLHRFPLEQIYPLNACFSPDGRWLVTGAGWAQGSRVIIWDLQTGQRKMELPAANQVAIRFDATGQRLVVGLSVYRVPEFTLEREFDGVNHMFIAAAFLANGDTLLTTDDRAGILKWRLSSPAPVRGALPLGPNPMTSWDWIPDSGGLLSAASDGAVFRALPPRFQREPVPELGTNVLSLSFITERKLLAVSRRDGSVSMHSMDSLAERARFRSNALPANWIFWIPQTKALGMLVDGGRLEVWDTTTQARTWDVDLLKNQELTGLTEAGVLWQLHVDGRLFGYDVTRKQVIIRQLDHDSMERLSVSRDGRWILTTSNEQPSVNGSRRLIDARTLKTVSQFEDADLSYPRGTAFWPGEPRAAFGFGTLVDLTTRRALLHLGDGYGLGISPFVSRDGNTLLILAPLNPTPTYVWWAPSWEEIRRVEAAEAAAGL